MKKLTKKQSSGGLLGKKQQPTVTIVGTQSELDIENNIVDDLLSQPDENGIYGSTLEYTYNISDAPVELFETIFNNVEKLYIETNNNIIKSLIGIVPNPESYKLTRENFYNLIKHEIPLIFSKIHEETPSPWLVHAGGDKIVCPIFDTEENYEAKKKSYVKTHVIAGRTEILEYNMDDFLGRLDFERKNVILSQEGSSYLTQYQLFNWYMFHWNTSSRDKYIDDVYQDGFLYKTGQPRSSFSKYISVITDLDLLTTMRAIEASIPDWLVIDQYDPSLTQPGIILNDIKNYPNPYADLFEPYYTKYKKIINNHNVLQEIQNYFLNSKKSLDQYDVNIDLISYFANEQIHPEYVLNYPEQYKAQLEERVLQWEGIDMGKLLKPYYHKTYISKYFSSFKGAELNDILLHFKNHTCIAVGIPWGIEYNNNSFTIKIDNENDDDNPDSRWDVEDIQIRYNHYFPYQETIKKYLYFLRGLSIDVSDILLTNSYVNLNSPSSDYQPNSEHIDDPKKMSLMSNVMYPELYFQKMTFTSKYSKIIYLLVDLSEYKNYTLTVEMEK